MVGCGGRKRPGDGVVDVKDEIRKGESGGGSEGSEAQAGKSILYGGPANE